MASAQFPKEVNEFVKAGFTMLRSDLIRPFRVGESPVQFECKVLQVIETGIEGFAGNLVISEMIKMHINSGILTENGKIDPDKIDLVGRMGGNYLLPGFRRCAPGSEDAGRYHWYRGGQPACSCQGTVAFSQGMTWVSWRTLIPFRLKILSGK